MKVQAILVVMTLSVVCATKVDAQDSDSAQPSKLVIDNAVLKVVDERKIPAMASGIIRQNNIREGKLVSEGELLMEIDNSQMEIEIRKSVKELEMAKLEAASRVDLEYAKRSIEVAEAELKRAVRSNERRPGVVPDSELDQLSLVVKKSNAEKEKTEFQMQMRSMSSEIRGIELELDRLKNQHHQIKSPLNGMIVEIYRRQGEWVDSSEAIARVVRLDKLKTEIKVPISIALDNLMGAEAYFVPKNQSTKTDRYRGEVVFVYPEANPISSEVRVWVEIKNEGLKLIPGLTGRLEISLAKTPNQNTKILESKASIQ